MIILGLMLIIKYDNIKNITAKRIHIQMQIQLFDFYSLFGVVFSAIEYNVAT